MTDVEEIIDYIKSLKKGFDKDLFQSKIDEIAYVVDSSGLDYDDFHTLFKVWLNLTIPITKWVSLGACLVPQNMVEERTVDYAFRWLLANYENHSNLSRMAFLLDWLTAAMDCASIDTVALDGGYEIFHIMLSFEVLTAHTIKLIYTLTKPSDVTRRRVLELLEYAQKREGKKNMYRQIQVLLGLYKSYRPECVPENVPAIAIHTCFKKINAPLMARFKKSQERRNATHLDRNHLLWINPLGNDGGKKKTDPLVPNMEFINIGSQQYDTKPALKNYLDFSDPASLLHHHARCGMARPARLRSLLANEAGLVLLATATEEDQAFFSLDLYHLLCTCFLEGSPHSATQKALLLRRVSSLQNTLLQPLPAVTRFLAQYLPLWDDTEYFAEILDLAEWLSPDTLDHVSYVVSSLTRVYLRAQPMEQCAVLKCLTNMYSNLVFSQTRARAYFQPSRPRGDITSALELVGKAVADVGDKALQVDPDDMRILHTTIRAACRCARAHLRVPSEVGPSMPAIAGGCSLAMLLLAPSAVLKDGVAGLLILYKKIFSTMKSANKLRKDEAYMIQRKTLEGYTSDLLNCLYHEAAIEGRNSGFVFNKLHQRIVEKLGNLLPDLDSAFSLRFSLAFAPYTYMALEALDPTDATNKMYFDTVVGQCFPNLHQFLVKVVPELRSV